MLMGGDLGRPWDDSERRSSTMVFIGRKLPRDIFIQGLEKCLVKQQ
jgi:G3E family GTPase